MLNKRLPEYIMKPRNKKINYLSNPELLKEIHKSKLTYCEMDDPKYGTYDIILNNVKDINNDTVAKAKENRLARLNKLIYDEHFSKGYRGAQSQTLVDEVGFKLKDILKSDLVFRVMTDEHIPTVINKNDKEVKEKLNFKPFKHYTISGGINRPQCVLTSHKKDGKITEALGRSFQLLVDKIGSKSNWRNYTWLDEMKGFALVRLCFNGLKFDESKSDNPFSFYTSLVNNGFIVVLNLEKRNSNVTQTIYKDSRIVLENGEAFQESYATQAQYDIDNYYRDKGLEDPYKKTVLTNPYKKFKPKLITKLVIID